MTRVPAGSALGRGWSAATELGADFPVPRENYREILRFRPRHAIQPWKRPAESSGCEPIPVRAKREFIRLNRE